MFRSLLNNPRFTANPLPHKPYILSVEIAGLRCLVTFFRRQNPRIYRGLAVATIRRALHGGKPVQTLQNTGVNGRRLLTRAAEVALGHKNGEKRAYFRRTALRTRDIERVLSNPGLVADIVAKIAHGTLSDSDAEAMQLLLRSAVAWTSSATYTNAAYDFLLDVWHVVFFERRQAAQLDPLRVTLAQNETRLIHVMANRGDFSAYEWLIAPLYERKPASLRPWAVTMMETLRPVAANGEYKCDSRAMRKFLEQPQYTREQKHQMIALSMTKTLLHGSLRQHCEAAVYALVDHFRYVEDALLFTENPHFHVYTRPLVLLALVGAEHSALARVQLIAELCGPHISQREVSYVLSAIAGACAELAPQTAILCWKYKTDVLIERRPAFSKRSSSLLSSQDLTHTMRAYVALRAYDQALKVYASHPHLQDDEQISLLLRASERSKDWALLQKQFEDMYGRGNLPYVVHYAVVMGALASIGSTVEVEQLYAQLLRRNLEPSAPVFLALVRCHINANSLERAEYWHGVFMDAVAAGKIPSKFIASLELEVLEAKLPLMSVAAAVDELEQLAQKQHDTQVPLISLATIRSMIHFVLSLYSLDGFERVWRVAEQWSLVDDSVYNESLAFLTKMGQFQRANDLAFVAQLHSPVPFQNSLILSAQLRNYRQWRKEVTDPQTKILIREQIAHILAAVDRNAVSPKNLDSLLLEVIKHYTAASKPELARPYLDKANSLNISAERHFIPFLKHYSAAGSYDDNSGVLDLYREMVARKTTITARTYYYLSRSLFVIDTANKNGPGNSFNLLQSVLEMYGFSVLDGNSSTKVSVADLSRNAIHLLKIVSDYAIEVSDPTEETMDLVLKFLKQIRQKLDKNIDYSFRVSILTEMSKVYRVYGDLQVASSLVDSALKEMDDIIDQLPAIEPLPKLLQLDYRKTVDIKTQILGITNAPPSQYVNLLRHVLEKNVRLSAFQFHNLGHHALKAAPVSKDEIALVLDFCERFLVLGNWAEVATSRKLHYIYRIYLVYLGRTMSPEAIAERYDILNKLYDVQDVSEVIREHRDIRNPRESLENALREYHALCPRELWPADRFFENLAEFFTAERTFDTRNFLKPNLAATLVTAIERLCDGDQSIAFTLYDEFPETMEYLLFYVGERTRVVKFRMGINKLLGQTGATPVDNRAARRQLSIETLQNLWGQ